MKKKSLLFIASASLLIASCSKMENLNPVNNGMEENPETRAAAASFVPDYPIYGVQILAGSPPAKLVTVNKSTGATSIVAGITTGGTNVGAAYGIAKIPGQNNAIICSSDLNYPSNGGNTLLSVNLANGVATKLGDVVIPGGVQLSDIEFNPVTNVLYGVAGNLLIRITNYGVAGSVMPGGPGVNATYAIVGELNYSVATGEGVGTAPFGICFNYLGDCAINSGFDHYRAIVDESVNTPGAKVPLTSARVKLQPTNLYSCDNVASVYSGLDAYTTVAGEDNPGLYLSRFSRIYGNAYQFKGYHSVLDMTSTASDGTK
jgi:hypothetical protein